MIKKVLVGLAALVVLAVVIVVVVVMSYDYNKFKAPMAEAVQKATGRQLTVGGDIDLSLGLTPALVVEDVRLANAPWGSRQDMVRLERFEVQVALLPLVGGSVEVQRFILIKPDILVETNAEGRSNLAFEPSAKAPAGSTPPPSPQGEAVALPAVSLAEMEIRDGRLTYRDGATGRSHQVSLTRLTAGMTAPTSPLTLALEGDYNGESFRVTGELGPLAAATDAAAPWPVKLDAEALDLEVGLDGTIRDLVGQKGIDLGFAVRASGLTRVMALAGQKPPVDLPVELSGRLQDAGPKAWRVAGLALNVDRSDLGGDLSVDLSGKRPRLTADLASRRLDVRALLPSGEDGAGGKAAAQAAPAGGDASGQKAPARTRVFPDDPLPLEGLGALDARVSLRVAELLLPKLAVNDLDTQLKLENGKLAVAPFKAGVGGGTLDATLGLARRGEAADAVARIAVDRLDMGRMLEDLGVTDLFEGRFDVDVDLRGSGGSVAALMAGLDGHTRIVMEKGRVGKSLMDVVGGDIASGVLRMLNPAAKNEAYTDINCCVVRFDVRRGLADATALVFDTSQMTVVGKGEVNLATERLDLSLKPTPKEGLRAGEFGKLSMSLGELTKPFKLSGTLAQPSLGIDAGQAALALGKAIGGAALFGPAGIAAALVGGDTAGEENPCVAAIEAARTGPKAASSGGTGRAAPASRPPAESNPLQQVGNALKGLFGN